MVSWNRFSYVLGVDSRSDMTKFYFRLKVTLGFVNMVFIAYLVSLPFGFFFLVHLSVDVV